MENLVSQNPEIKLFSLDTKTNNVGLISFWLAFAGTNTPETEI